MSTNTGPLAQALQPFIDKGIVAGLVALAGTKSEILSLEAIGWEDVSAKKPMTADSLFWIASLTKPITATALMMLVDEGRIHLDDPVEQYLPEFKGQMLVVEQDENHCLLRKPDHPITVREILNHTSGLPFSSPIETPFFDQLPLETAVRSYASLPLQSEPGSKYSYSNAGTNTVGRLIEVLTKQPYATFLDERLLRPLGMNETSFWPSEKQLQRYATVYKSNTDNPGLEEMEHSQLTPPFSNRSRFPLPAGGLFSTASDILKFCQMILNGGVYQGKSYISKYAIGEMTRKQTADTIEVSYGLGWNSEPKFGHGGAYKASMTIDPKLGLINILLLHHHGAWHAELGMKLLPTFMEAAEKLVV